MEGTIKELRKRYLATETRHFADELKRNHHRPEFIAAAMMNIGAEIIRDNGVGQWDPSQNEKKRGRPVVRPFPDPIPDTPENIARIALTTPPKKKAILKVLMGKKKKE